MNERFRNTAQESQRRVNPATESNTVAKDPIRIVVADDHPIVRDGLKRLLALEDDFEVVGEASDGQQAVELVRSLEPDVLLLDLRMPRLDGMLVLETLRHVNGTTKVIVLTASEDRGDSVQAMKLGCAGVVRKQTAPDLIVKSIRKVHVGEIWLDSETTAAVMRHFSSPVETWVPQANGKDRQRSPLSTREKQIVSLVARGFRNKEMAEKLFISEQTVKNHLHNIFDKLGISDRLELALYAVHNGLHLSRKESEEAVEVPELEREIA